MSNLIFGIAIAGSILFWNTSGYHVEDQHITFTYYTSSSGHNVYVCGNFMNWVRNAPDWKMTWHEDGFFHLKKPVTELRASGRSFYEFTFLVDGELVDADRGAEHIIHCPGHGYRYVIRW